ncbi:MAG: hypothetical protein JWR15_4631, partial [Prosthecobacter sp.]|nr:hypothetical protein [Prosthecobacter sp.]
MKKTLLPIILLLLQATSLVHAQVTQPAPPPAVPPPATHAMEGKLDNIIGKIENNERLDTKLDGIITRLDSSDRVASKLDSILSALKEHDQKLEKLATAPAVPAAAATAAVMASPSPAAAPAATAPPASGDVSLVQSNLNDVWIIVTAAMVFFMQAG